jgi:hypothetical protein
MHAKWCSRSRAARATAMKAAVLLLSDGTTGTVDLSNRELGIQFTFFT